MATTQKTTPITLTLTDKAAVEVRKFMADEHASAETAGLRVAVLPSGCSGFRYSLSIEEKPLDDDFVVETGGVRCFVDAFSAQHLNGTVIDFRSNFQESGFAFENPNATGGLLGRVDSTPFFPLPRLLPVVGPPAARSFFAPPRPARPRASRHHGRL